MRRLFRRLDSGEAVFDFIGSRRRWYLVSALLLLLCLGSFLFRGFNLGIEFAGGTSFQFRAASAQPAEAQEVAEQAGAEVPSTPQVVGAGGTRSILIRAGELSTEQQIRVSEALESRFDQEVTVQAVSSSWGSNITSAAIRALLIFLIAVCIFIAVRFEWKMAVGAVVALFHDLVLTAGIYSLVGFEVTPSTVVGLLTILGFSLYDTVVVYDKVDENARGILGGSRTTYSGAANLAVNQTLMRSINTSLIALLPVAGLLFVGAGVLGVGTIKDLALVLFVGLAAGAYSSIFLATPVLADLKEREPDQVALRKRVLARRSAEARQRQAGGRGPAGTLGGGRAPVASARRARRPGPAQAAAQGAGVGTTFADDDLPALVDADVQIESPESVSRDGGSTAAPRPGARPQRPGQQRRPAAKKRR